MLLAFFDNIDVLKVLGYGLSGFAFLLMLFAFLLLRQLISKDNESNKMVFTSIWGFMGLSFLMTIVIGMFSFFVTDYKSKEVKDLGSAVQTYSDAKQLNAQIEKADSSGMLSNPDSLKHFKEGQDKIVSSLDSTIKSSDVDASVKNRFDQLKGERENVYSQLNMAVTDVQKDSLSKKVLNVDKQLTKLTLDAVEKKPVVMKYMNAKTAF